jgi:hypothetical protein
LPGRIRLAIGSVALMATFFASTAGNDANSGTGPSAGSAKRTIAAGAALLGPGDILLVRGLGTDYDEGIGPYIAGGASWGGATRIAAYPGETVWMQPSSDSSTPSSIGSCIWLSYNISYIEFDGINCDGTYVTRPPVWFSTNDGYNPHHIRFQNAEVIGGTIGASGAILLGNHTTVGAIGSHQVLNNVIHGGGIAGGCGYACSSYGVYMAGPDNLVDGNEIYDVSGFGMQVYNSAGDAAINNTVTNNYIHDISRTGDLDQCGGIIIAGNSNTFYNNVIDTVSIGNVNAANAGLYIYYGDGNRFWNNTIYNTSNSGIYLAASAFGNGGATNTDTRNNLVYLQGGTAYINNGGGTNTQSNNMFSGVNPGFVNAAAGDFQISTTGAAYRTGAFLSTVTTDILGVTRNNPPSIGAFEGDDPPPIEDGDIVVVGDNTGDTYPGIVATRIRKDTPTTNFGGQTILTVEKYDASAHGSTLLRATGLSAIAPGSVVLDATLNVYLEAVNGVGGTNTISMYRLLRSWTEAGATWNTFDGSTSWGTVGALNTTTDRSSVAAASASVASTTGAWYQWTGAQFIAEVQAFIDGSLTNDGWVLERTDGGAGDETSRIFTSEEGVDGHRPYLTVTVLPDIEVVSIGDNSSDDVAGTSETHIQAEFTTSNAGSNPQLSINKYAAGFYINALIKFDLSSLMGRTVTDAALGLYYEFGSLGDNTFTLRRLLRNWTEAGATWNTYDGSNNWGTAGATNASDRSATASGSVVITETDYGYYEVQDAQLIADVQDMLDGAVSNYGWVIERSDGADDFTYKVFTASEGADGFRPYLRLTLEAEAGVIIGAMYFPMIASAGINFHV